MDGSCQPDCFWKKFDIRIARHALNVGAVDQGVNELKERELPSLQRRGAREAAGVSGANASPIRAKPQKSSIKKSITGPTLPRRPSRDGPPLWTLRGWEFAGLPIHSYLQRHGSIGGSEKSGSQPVLIMNVAMCSRIPRRNCSASAGSGVSLETSASAFSHELHPAIACSRIDAKWRVPGSKPGMAALLDVARRTAESIDQKIS
jgi:hypothetical protein